MTIVLNYKKLLGFRIMAQNGKSGAKTGSKPGQKGGAKALPVS